ncbi:MAG: hypothetical protein ACREOZ_01715, partial [Gloeomargaritales cyanobacterium]
PNYNQEKLYLGTTTSTRQRHFADDSSTALEESRQFLGVLDAEAGKGKTFTLKVIFTSTKRRGFQCIATRGNEEEEEEGQRRSSRLVRKAPSPWY